MDASNSVEQVTCRECGQSLPVVPVRPVTLADLPQAERVALELLTAGLPNADIASRLGKSRRTITNQLATLYERIGAENRVQAATWYLRQTEQQAAA